jgi:hypothetical protein
MINENIFVPFFRETMKNPHVIINRMAQNTVNPVQEICRR